VKIVEIGFETKNITEIHADYIILKNGVEGLVGPEEAVNNTLGGILSEYNHPPYTNIGSIEMLCLVRGIATRNIILVGIGMGSAIRYDTINLMCMNAIEAIFKHNLLSKSSIIATVSHGVGWGLDRKEVFKTQLFSFKDALEKFDDNNYINKIIFGEIQISHTKQLKSYIEELANTEGSKICKRQNKYFLELGESSELINNYSSRVGGASYVFIAMPFDHKFENVYDFGMRLPIENNNLLPIRIDRESFTGSILEEIKQRIIKSSFIIADITDLNPNVLFELGYAQGSEKITIIICSEGQQLPFDIAGMNVVFYDPLLIRGLNNKLSNMIQKLKSE